MILLLVVSAFVIIIFSYNKFFNNKKTSKKVVKDVKIIATLGKEGWKNIHSFCESGANIFRINGSHIKSEENLKQTLDGVNQEIINEKCQNVEVMYDTQGPEIRVLIVEQKDEKNADNEPASYEIEAGDIIIAHTNLNDKEIVYKGDYTRLENKKKVIHIGINYKGFVNDVKQEMILTIENRTLYAKVENIDKGKGEVKMLITEINTKDGKYNLTDRRHINLIGYPVSLPTLTENDKKYIKMSALAGVNYYAISFVRDDKDIDEVRALIKSAFVEAQKTDEEINKRMNEIKIIAKIETKQGLENFEQIIKKADGSMVARGDLASEIPMIEVPYAKIKIVELSNKYKKFSIMATDVLESLTRQEIISRNDIDVVVSILQLNVSAIMLSNETAQGNKGNKAIATLKSIIEFDKSKRIANNSKVQ